MQGLFLGKNEAKKIHAATLTVLEKTGIQMEHDGAKEMLLQNGAEEDPEGRILLPRKMVQKALEDVTRGFEVYDRDGILALEIRFGNTYFGPGSDAIFQIDKKTHKMRQSKLEDVGENARIADALGFDFIMSMALPHDSSPNRLYAEVFSEMVKNSAKPIVATAVSLNDVKYTHEIASLISGGKEAFLEKPWFIAYVEPVSPLKFDKVGVDKLLYCAEHGIPFVCAAGANCGIGAPITPEGGVVQGGAESLAGLVIALLKNPKARFIYGSNTSSADMRSGMVCYGSPEWCRTVAMYADMGEFYNLPSWGTAGCTDSSTIDSQAAWEACRSIMMALQSRSTLVHDMGYMCFGELWDARMLVLVMEIVKETKHNLRPIDLSDETLATHVIDEVARASSLYLGNKHTSKNFRKTLWMSKLINRVKVTRERDDIVTKLGRHVQMVMEKHDPRLLDDDKSKALDDYLGGIQ